MPAQYGKFDSERRKKPAHLLLWLTWIVLKIRYFFHVSLVLLILFAAPIVLAAVKMHAPSGLNLCVERDGEKTCKSAGGSSSTGFKTVKVMPPPLGGMYIGQYEWNGGSDRPTFESAVDRHAPFGGREDVIDSVNRHPRLDFDVANSEWNNGRLPMVRAYELVLGEDYGSDEGYNPRDFTVEKLLVARPISSATFIGNEKSS